MNNIEMIAFEMISEIGNAKSLFMESLDLAEKKDFDQAEKLINEGKKCLLNAHKPHMSLIQQEANGESIEFSLLLMHAEDQLMTTEMLKELAIKMIRMYRQI